MVLNCQSLAPKVDTLMDIVKLRQIDVCFLTETWLKKAKNETTSHIKEYSFRTFHSNTFGRGRGTAMLLRSSLKYKKVELGSCYSSFDSVVLHLANRTALVCIYRYGNFGNAFELFLLDLAAFLSDLVLSCDSYILCGDFNIHFNKPFDAYTIKFKDVLDEFDLYCFTPIVPTQKLGNTLDLVISNMLISSDIKDISVENHYPLGDHFPIFFSVNNACDLNEIRRNPHKQVRHFKKIDKTLFKTDLQRNISESFGTLPESFQSAVHNYNECLLQTLDKHAPKTSKKIEYCYRPN